MQKTVITHQGGQGLGVTDGDEIVVVEDVGDPVLRVEDGAPDRLADVMNGLALVGYKGRRLQFEVTSETFLSEPADGTLAFRNNIAKRLLSHLSFD